MNRNRLQLVVGCAVALSLSVPLAAREGDFVSLFDGKTLEGWTVVGAGDFRVTDGEIHATAGRKSFLRTDRSYGDFVLEVEVNVEPGGNSGIQFRSHVTDGGKLYGYQAEVDTSSRAWAGGLYDEGRRGWIHPLEGRPGAQRAFKNGEWNRYRITAIGDRIRISVNGVETTDVRDPADLEGVVALQHHGEKGKLYRFRNIRIRKIGRSHWKPLFDGESLDGWTSNGFGQWTVEEGDLVGRSRSTEANHGLLLSNEQYADFTVRLKFKAIAGNSGLYFRAEKNDRPARCAGFQAEIDPARDVGGLYETYGRAWVVQPSTEAVAKFFRPGEWNELVVSAHGRHIVVHVNGTKTAELKDDPGRLEGFLGLQLHGGQDMHVRFREISILESDR